jgi:aldehyde dehydrogenase (NAD+)
MFMIVRDSFYIDGAWVSPSGSDTLEVIDSTTEEVFATIPPVRRTTSIEQSRRRSGLPQLGGHAGQGPRAPSGQKIAEGLQARAGEIADVISHEVGMPRSLTETFQVGLPIGEFAGNAERAASYVWQEEIGNSLVMKEPVGVVGAITPWNFPSTRSRSRSHPALAAGCTVVLKPSEVAPINAFILAEIIHEVGLPKGVFNLVTGLGPVVGEAIAAHPWSTRSPSPARPARASG